MCVWIFMSSFLSSFKIFNLQYVFHASHLQFVVHILVFFFIILLASLLLFLQLMVRPFFIHPLHHSVPLQPCLRDPGVSCATECHLHWHTEGMLRAGETGVGGSSHLHDKPFWIDGGKVGMAKGQLLLRVTRDSRWQTVMTVHILKGDSIEKILHSKSIGPFEADDGYKKNAKNYYKFFFFFSY